MYFFAFCLPLKIWKIGESEKSHEIFSIFFVVEILFNFNTWFIVRIHFVLIRKMWKQKIHRNHSSLSFGKKLNIDLRMLILATFDNSQAILADFYPIFFVLNFWLIFFHLNFSDFHSEPRQTTSKTEAVKKILENWF